LIPVAKEIEGGSLEEASWSRKNAPEPTSKSKEDTQFGEGAHWTREGRM
jgi:hypothetical protein